MSTAAPDERKAMPVSAIRNGTVIDHIPSGKAILLLKLLKLGKETEATLGIHLPSKRMGRKDLIKVSGREISPEEASRIAIFAPNATINLIRNYETVQKFQVQLPEEVANLLICPNPTCITRQEESSRLFVVENSRKEARLKCRYCEESFLQHEIEEYAL